ncbi:hypothetical protein FAIPA1_10103 [Frankia sp. AiPs1]
MRARTRAPAHIVQGSRVTARVVPVRRQEPSVRAAARRAMTSAWAVGSASRSRALKPSPSTVPSAASTTAPTGTSPCAKASRAWSSARPIAASWRPARSWCSAEPGAVELGAVGLGTASATGVVEDLSCAGAFAQGADQVGGEHALLADQLEQVLLGGAEIGEQVEIADGGGLQEAGGIVVLVVIVGGETGHRRQRVGEQTFGEGGTDQDAAVGEEDLGVGVVVAQADDRQVLVVLLKERHDRAVAEIAHGVGESVEVVGVVRVEVVHGPTAVVPGDRDCLRGHCCLHVPSATGWCSCRPWSRCPEAPAPNPHRGLPVDSRSATGASVFRFTPTGEFYRATHLVAAPRSAGAHLGSPHVTDRTAGRSGPQLRMAGLNGQHGWQRLGR